MRYLANAFSLQMLSNANISNIIFKKITKERAINILKSKYSNVDNKLHIVFDGDNVKSTIGHQELTEFLTGELGSQVPYNRVGLNLKPEDTIIVAQVSSGRVTENKPASYSSVSYYMVEMKADWHAYFYMNNNLVKSEDFKCLTKTEAYKELNNYLLTSMSQQYDDLDFTYTV